MSFRPLLASKSAGIMATVKNSVSVDSFNGKANGNGTINGTTTNGVVPSSPSLNDSKVRIG